MFKHLRYSLLTLLLAVFTGAWAQTPEVVYDMTSGWEFDASAKTMTKGDVTFNAYGSASFKQNTGYVMLGKSGAYLELPAYDFDVEKIEVVGHNGASGSVKQNIFVDDVAVSTETTGANGVTNTYEIAEEYQAAGNVYTLKVTSNHNTQIEAIKVYKAAVEKTPVASNISFKPLLVEPGSDGMYTLTASYADGATYQVSLESSDEDLFKLFTSGDHLGEYVAGNTEGTAEVTVTITPTGENAANYTAVTQTFEVLVEDSRTPVANNITLTPQSMNVGDEDSFNLSADILDGCNVTVESSNPTILSVSSDGTVNYENFENAFSYQALAVGAVDVTVTFVPFDEENYKPSTKTVSVTVTDSSLSEIWVKTDFVDLEDGDVIVIVDQTSSTAMSNDNGADDAPNAVSVTLTDDKSKIDSTVDGIIQFVVGIVDGGYQFKIADTDNYLYCTGSNNGVRVGTNSNNVFSVVEHTNGVEFLKNNATGRFLGVYNNHDWRCYTSVNTNIQNTVTAIYKKTLGTDRTPIADVSTLTLEPTQVSLYGEDRNGQLILDGTFEDTYTITYESSDDDSFEVYLAGDTYYYYAIAEGSYDVKVTITPDDEETYKPVYKTFTVAVVDNREDAGIAFNPDTYKGNINTEVEDDVVFENPYEVTVTFASSNDNIATFAEGVLHCGQAGTATITAIFEGDTNYKPVETTLTVTVVDPANLRTYMKVTSPNDLVGTAKYLIVYEDGGVAFDGSLDNLDATPNVKAVEINNGMITTDENIYFMLDAGKIISASNHSIGRTTYDNGLEMDGQFNTNNVTFDGDGNVDITMSVGDNKVMTLRYNAASNQNRFRYYKSGQQPIQLYMEIEIPDSVEITIGQYKAATISSKYPLDFTNTGVRAFIVTGREDGIFTREEVTTIPANTGVLVSGAQGTYRIPVAVESETDNVEGNLLVATSTGEYTVTADDYGTVYGLFYSTKQKKIGFQLKKEGFVFGADKCYLRMPAATSANEIFFDFDTDAIVGIDTDNDSTDGNAYNVSGQKVNKSYKGIVIRNGKKMIQK